MIPLPLKQNQRRLICMDTSFCSKQEDYTTEQTSACMVTKATTKFTDTIEMIQKSFLVFISHLLSLFTASRSCHQLCTAWRGCLINRWELPSVYIIRQPCNHCGHVWMWNSQPFIKNTSWKHTIISAAFCLVGLHQLALHF